MQKKNNMINVLQLKKNLPDHLVKIKRLNNLYLLFKLMLKEVKINAFKCVLFLEKIVNKNDDR